MQIHQIKRKTRLPKRKRVGRGGKRGKTSGKGHKGQKARAGKKIRPEIRDMIKKLPKKRGYKFKSKKVRSSVVNVSALNRAFEDGEKVTPESLLKKKIISASIGKRARVKILGGGIIKKKLDLSGFQISKSAKEKIEKAGGTIS